MQPKGTYKYLFSIIVPVYNVEDYLAEALNSIINQAGGFFDRTEIIVIDDGSTDGSFKIAQDYQNRYPHNIVAIHQQNSGVSTAKNTGIEHAQGEFLGFLDSDDRYQRNLLKNVAKFFDSISVKEADVVAFPMVFFDAQTGAHRLNRKFNAGTRIIDVCEDWQDVQLSSASTFIRKTCIDALNLRFNKNLMLGEDAAFITEAIMYKKRFGVINSSNYEYRKRVRGGSAIDSFQSNPKAYLPVLENAWVRLLNHFEKDGTAPKYVQNVVCHDLEWRLKQKEQHALSDNEYEKYRETIVSLLKRIDDDVILSQRFFGAIHKVYALSLKYGENPQEIGNYVNDKFIYRNHELWKAAPTSFNLQVDYLDYNNGHLKIHGRFTGFITPELTYGAYVEHEFIPATLERVPSYRQIKNNGTLVFEPAIVSFNIPLKAGQSVSFGVLIGAKQIKGVRISFLNAARMSNFPNSYRCFDDVIVLNKHGHGLEIKSKSLITHVTRELFHERKMAWALLKGRTLPLSIPFYRIAAKLGKALKRKEIWIISDRPFAAGDNGEALFRYLVQHKPSKTRVYFSIKENAAEYGDLSKLGKVINQDTTIGKLLFLLSDEIISSQADEVVLNPFEKYRQGVLDLYDYKFRFLQHGITKDDLSSWLNKYTKDIKTFVTTSPYEYKSIVEGDYGYSSKEVALTGFPRFDLLHNNPQKTIIIAPTWRATLAGSVDSQTGMRMYSEKFTSSDYFKFYQALMQDVRLNACLERNGYQAKLFLHPNHLANADDFAETKAFTVSRPPHDYKTMFAEAAVLVTDYSSVAFDFAYLKKPVLYTQFDKEEFFEKHSYSKGYFDYETDGFGPVVDNVEKAVNELIFLIENNCKQSQLYLERVNAFFAYFDRNNSARVVEAIMQSKAEER